MYMFFFYFIKKTLSQYLVLYELKHITCVTGCSQILIALVLFDVLCVSYITHFLPFIPVLRIPNLVMSWEREESSSCRLSLDDDDYIRRKHKVWHPAVRLRRIPFVHPNDDIQSKYELRHSLVLTLCYILVWRHVVGVTQSPEYSEPRRGRPK